MKKYEGKAAIEWFKDDADQIKARQGSPYKHNGFIALAMDVDEILSKLEGLRTDIAQLEAK